MRLLRVRRYKSFKSDEIKLPNHHKAIIVYLNRISIRLFNDHYRKERKEDAIHRTYFDDIHEKIDSTIDFKALKEKKDLSVIIFNKLNEKEKRVVLADTQHKKHQKYLPDDVTATLAEELSVKHDTIRKIRKRAIEKILKAIDESNKN
ncbi:MAG: sigma-70 family RNA polymerase sigma factor [Bacteroidetes bacterium]|nr:sigma-70 family RNA polymerase sigma factor [Bacteroidota bacterium]